MKSLKQFPSEPGIYLLTHRSSGLRYVGQSVNIRNRIQSHIRNQPWAGWLHSCTAMSLGLVDDQYLEDWQGPRLEWDGSSEGWYDIARRIQADLAGETLQVMPGATKDELHLAEKEWIKGIHPELNVMHTSNKPGRWEVRYGRNRRSNDLLADDLAPTQLTNVQEAA